MDAATKALFERAVEASKYAYSPYSNVKVGACVLDDQGRMHSGCNVENASYGLTQCAERNALANAISTGMPASQANTILIYAEGFEVLTPCGACRQVMSELLPQDATVISCVSDTQSKSWTVGELLPDPFKLK